MIYVVSLYYLPLINPPATRMGHLVRFLVARYGGENVTVVTGRPNYPDGVLPPEFRWKLFRRKKGQHGESVHHLYEYATPFQGLYMKTFGLISFAVSMFFYFLFKPIKREDRIIITTGPSFPVYGLYFLKKIRWKLDYILDVRDLWPQVVAGMGFLDSAGRAYRLLDRLSDRTYAAAECVVGVSEGIHAHLARVVGKDRLHLIHNPVDLELFRPLAEDENEAFRRSHLELWDRPDRVSFIFTGAFSHYVDLMTFMEAVQETVGVTRNFRVILIGDGEEKPTVEAFVKEHELQEYVTLLPFVLDKQELVQYLCAADYCFASLGDSPHLRYATPTKILEYMACNKTVLAAIKGPFAEMLKEAEAAVVTDPGDASGLSKKLVELINAQEQILLAQAPRKFIQENYSLKKFDEEFAALFDDD